MFNLFKKENNVIQVNKHFELLGQRVEDKVTGFTGIVDSLCFDLYGCIQAAINPGQDEKKEIKTSMWFDISRLKIIDSTPVMDRPNFEYGTKAEGLQGPANKPAFNK
jgi:hypothetical protein